MKLWLHALGDIVERLNVCFETKADTNNIWQKLVVIHTLEMFFDC